MWHCKNCGAENNDGNYRCGLCMTSRSTTEIPSDSPAFTEPPDRPTAPTGVLFCKYCGKSLYTESGGPTPAYCPHCGKFVGSGHSKPPVYRHRTAANRTVIWAAGAIVLMIALVVVLVVGARKPSGAQVKSTIMQVLNSTDNPLAGKFKQYDIALQRSNTANGEYQAVYNITEESERSQVVLTLELHWSRYDQGWELTNSEVLDYNVSPFAGPDDAEIRSNIDGIFEDMMSIPYASEANAWTTDVLSHSWKTGDVSDSASVHIVVQFNIYQKIIDGSVNMRWDSSDEVWRGDNSYLTSSLMIDTVTYDFSQLNGVWQGVYSHDTTYLADNLPYQITLSNCGTITNTGDSFTEASVRVEHEFNDIWVDYSEVHYASGNLTISVQREGSLTFAPSFVIEIPVEGFILSTKATLRIDPEELVFEDPLAKEQVLVQAS